MTESTAVTNLDNTVKRQNKYFLFEKLLSFVDTEEELNPVLCGYFCKVFSVLVSNKPKEVFSYIYSNTQVLDNLVRHINQKSISEVLIRLLNTSENVLSGEGLNSAEIDSIRQSFVYKIVNRFDPALDMEDHINT